MEKGSQSLNKGKDSVGMFPGRRRDDELRIQKRAESLTAKEASPVWQYCSSYSGGDRIVAINRALKSNEKSILFFYNY